MARETDGLLLAFESIVAIMEQRPKAAAFGGVLYRLQQKVSFLVAKSKTRVMCSWGPSLLGCSKILAWYRHEDEARDNAVGWGEGAMGGLLLLSSPLSVWWIEQSSEIVDQSLVGLWVDDKMGQMDDGELVELEWASGWVTRWYPASTREFVIRTIQNSSRGQKRWEIGVRVGEEERSRTRLEFSVRHTHQAGLGQVGDF